MGNNLAIFLVGEAGFFKVRIPVLSLMDNADIRASPFRFWLRSAGPDSTPASLGAPF